MRHAGRSTRSRCCALRANRMSSRSRNSRSTHIPQAVIPTITRAQRAKNNFIGGTKIDPFRTSGPGSLRNFERLSATRFEVRGIDMKHRDGEKSDRDTDARPIRRTTSSDPTNGDRWPRIRQRERGRRRKKNGPDTRPVVNCKTCCVAQRIAISPLRSRSARRRRPDQGAPGARRDPKA